MAWAWASHATFRWFTVLLGGVEPVVSDPRDEPAAVPDIISSGDGGGGGGEGFSAFAVSRWPGLVRRTGQHAGWRGNHHPRYGYLQFQP
jgi:hypothetical protein